jgi:hypothetical protein
MASRDGLTGDEIWDKAKQTYRPASVVTLQILIRLVNPVRDGPRMRHDPTTGKLMFSLRRDPCHGEARLAR